MADWVNIAAFVISVVAIWFTIRESRFNHGVVLSIHDVKAHATMSVERPNEVRHEFIVLIRNHGISLHQVKATISFVPTAEGGRMNLSLKRRQLPGDRDDFARGMLAEFYISDVGTDPAARRFIGELQDAHKQRAELLIFSQDYLAKAFRIGRRVDGWKTWWNHIAFRVNSQFDRGKPAKDGTKPYHSAKVLPIFQSVAPKFDSFRRMVDEDSQREKA